MDKHETYILVDELFSITSERFGVFECDHNTHRAWWICDTSIENVITTVNTVSEAALADLLNDDYEIYNNLMIDYFIRPENISFTKKYLRGKR